MKKQAGRKSRYSSEFKAEAVRLCSVDERSQNQIAKSLGINQTALNRWVRESQKATLPMSGDVVQRLKELEDENRRLRMEHEILKKAAAFFAKNQS